MENKNLFNAIIVDTNAFDEKGNDFCGYYNSLLPMFFDSIRKLNLQLISHPILQGETIKHIENSDWANKPANVVKSIVKNKAIFNLISVSVNDLIIRLESLDLSKDTISAFQNEFSTAIILPYSDPAKIFDNYFAARPPFAETGNKKAEFPDAFVIDSLENFLKDHPEISILAISNDNDWKRTFIDIPNVRIADNIDVALQLLNKHEKNLSEFIEKIYCEIEEWIGENTTGDTWFDSGYYQPYEDIDVISVELDYLEENYIPLTITDNRIVLQTTANLLVAGETTVLDENNSIWDPEDREYIYTSYGLLEFQDAEGQAKCEIHIDLDEDMQPSLSSLKIIAPHGIMLAIDESKVTFTEIDPEADWRADMFDALEEYYNH